MDSLNALIAHVTDDHNAMRPNPDFNVVRYAETSGCVKCNKMAASVKRSREVPAEPAPNKPARRVVVEPAQSTPTLIADAEEL